MIIKSDTLAVTETTMVSILNEAMIGRIVDIPCDHNIARNDLEVEEITASFIRIYTQALVIYLQQSQWSHLSIFSQFVLMLVTAMSPVRCG